MSTRLLPLTVSPKAPSCNAHPVESQAASQPAGQPHISEVTAFETHRAPCLAPRDANLDTYSQGRGTNDDSIGRGTNDDSIGRGTNDDSIGRGTNDDSIGKGSTEGLTRLKPAFTGGLDPEVFANAAVFNPTFYAAHNPDLAAAGVTTDAQLKNHWLTIGVREGRQGSATFDAKWCMNAYRDSYPELVKTPEQTIRSWYELTPELKGQIPTSALGLPDARFRGIGGPPVRDTSTSPLNAEIFANPTVFDPAFYASRNPDLADAGITASADLERHWLTFGVREGRQGSAQFDPKWCMNQYPNLRTPEQAIRGWHALSADAKSRFATSALGVPDVRRRSIEGDSVANVRTPLNAEIFANPTVFNAAYYAAHNPDLAAAGIHTDAQLTKHWLLFGVREGRQGSADFDPKWCMATYRDKYPGLVKTAEQTIRTWVSLPAALKAQVPTSARGVPVIRAQTPIDEGVQTRLEALSQMSTVGREVADRLFAAPGFSAASNDVKNRVLALALKTGDSGAKALGRMFERVGVFEGTDVRGGKLLATFEKLAGSQHPAAQAVLSAAMADVANPERIWQGDSPTCTVTSMQHVVAKSNPAEYVRLLAGLALDGQVAMAGGGRLEVNAGTDLSAGALARQQRTVSEALFQDAAMEFANGSETYNAKTQRSTRADGTTHAGLNGVMIRIMLRELSGLTYVRRQVDDDGQAARLAEELARKATLNQPVLIDLDEGSFNHCVAFDRVANGFVYVRDPESGRGSRLSLSQFNKRAVAVYAPD